MLRDDEDRDVPTAQAEWEPGFRAELILRSDDLEFAAVGPLRVEVLGRSDGLPQMTPEQMERFLQEALRKMLADRR
jgi:hypothetical protein